MDTYKAFQIAEDTARGFGPYVQASLRALLEKVGPALKPYLNHLLPTAERWKNGKRNVEYYPLRGLVLMERYIEAERGTIFMPRLAYSGDRLIMLEDGRLVVFERSGEVRATTAGWSGGWTATATEVTPEEAEANFGLQGIAERLAMLFGNTITQPNISD